MALTKFTNGTIADADEVNANFEVTLRQNGLNAVQQLQDRAITFSADGGQFAEAYVDSNGRNNSVDTASTSATFDTDKYAALSVPSFTGPYVIVETTQAISVAINDCLHYLIGVDKYLIYCTVGTDAEKRAKIYKSLFYGTTGANPSITQSVTAIRTSESGDVGKKVSSCTLICNNSSTNTTSDFTGTFSDTSTNTDSQVWSYCQSSSVSLTSHSMQFPSATTVNEVTTPSAISDETETDTSADNQNNPATVKLDIIMNGSGGSANDINVKGFILHKGTISWVETDPLGRFTSTETDFGATYACNFTLADTVENETDTPIITHTIPSGTFSSTLSSAFATFKAEDWESGADVQFKLQTLDFSTLNTNSYVEITGDLVDPTAVELNNCFLIKKSDGVYFVASTSTDDEVARAEIYGTLFFGTTGANPAITTGFANVTAIKTTVTRDVGKRAIFAKLTADASVNSTYTGTFNDTTNNTDCSSWAYFIDLTGTDVGTMWTDTTADEQDNPATCQIQSSASTDIMNWEMPSGSTLTSEDFGTISTGDTGNALILCEGTISWVLSGAGSTAGTNTDFFADLGIPLLTNGATGLPTTQEETGYLSSNQVVSFTAFNYEPRKQITKLIPKTTNPTAAYPSINGVALYGDRPA